MCGVGDGVWILRVSFRKPVIMPPRFGPGPIILAVLPMTLLSAWDGSVYHPARFRTNSSGLATWCTMAATMLAEFCMY